MSLTNQQLVWLANNQPWTPQPGPQTDAMYSKADVLLYGGAAGGGKTSLAIGLAVLHHKITLFLRREGTQLGGVLEEVAKVTGDIERKGYSAQPFREWKVPAWDGIKRKIVFGSTPNMGDELRYQGRERDLLVIDEAANMLEEQAKFLMGWTRSDDPNQRCRVLFCSNPPTNAEGYWLFDMFAPWLDPNYKNPAKDGELRWFSTIDGEHTEVEEGFTQKINGRDVAAQSYSFIPAKVTDNKYIGDRYMSVLNAMPEPARSQMLYGSWTVGRDDAEWQVIPSEWVEIAMARWAPRLFNPTKIVSAGLDPSRGGKDSTVLAAREDWYYHALQEWPGHEIPDGQTVAAKVIELLGLSHCPVHTDVIGIGASVVDILGMYIHNRVVPVNVAEAAKEDTDWSGTLKFGNKRAQLWWQFRDILNPANGFNVSLPPDQLLKAELCAPTYQMRASGIMVESKMDIKKRLGRSTDKADAVLMAAERTAILNMTGLSGRVQVNR